MSSPANRLDRDRAALDAVEGAGPGKRLSTYLRLSGPGWLQSAITLGGGSLAGGLYLGVLSGYGMMWLQPLAMLLGVAMLAAIAYVTLSTGRRPFRLVVDEVNPVLGWGWAIATLMANVVWCLPQFALGIAALRQNLLPGWLGPEATGPVGGETGVWVAVALLATVALLTIISYERGGRGLTVFEGVLKLLVGVIVLSFVGVVIKLTGVEGGIDWGAAFGGLLPDWNSFTEPPAAFRSALAETTDAGRAFWTAKVLGDQRDVMLTAAATAVGINMTFLLPNSLLDRGWDRRFRGLATFDLATALLLPFLIATACVVMASTARFHGQYNEAMVAAELTPEATAAAGGPAASGQYLKLLQQRADATGEGDLSKLTPGDRQLAAMLIRRDAFDLAEALAPLTGKAVAQLVFGVGVAAMALSTIVVLMLINGYVVCEITGAPRRGVTHFLGALVPLALGVFAPVLWTGDAKVWLAVPTSVIGFILLPIAYVTFFLLINNRRVLGDAMLTGGTRLAVNALLLVAVALATIGAAISIQSKAGVWGFVAAGALIALAVAFRRKGVAPTPATEA